MRALAADQAQLTGAQDSADLSHDVPPADVTTAARNMRQLFWLFLALGTLLTLVNRQWPLARNALNYAKAAVWILHRHFNLFAVVRDQYQTGGKPILFSALAAPFVALTNAVTGVLIASALGTALFLYTVTLALPRLNRRAGLDARLIPIEFLFVVCNPLVLYQFWSGFPDSLFAGLVMLAFVLTDIIATEPERDTRWHIVGLGITISVAILTKLYGAILVGICPVYVLFHARELAARSTYPREKVALLIGALAMGCLVLVTAKLQINPLLKLDGASGANDYSWGMAWINTKDGLWMLAFALLLAFHVSWASCVAPRFWRRWPLAPAVFVAVYILGLLPVSGIGSNMRYFLPAFPFVAPVLANGVRSMQPLTRNVLLGVYGLLSAALILNFNISRAEVAFQPLTTELREWQPSLEDWLDNLRLPVQIELKKQIDTINAEIPSGGTLYWCSDYYGTTTHDLAHHLGVRSDINVRYFLEPVDVPESSAPVFLTLFTSLEPPENFWPLPQWATTKPLGHGVFRLDPIAVSLHSVGGDFALGGEPITLKWQIAAQGNIQARDLTIVDGTTLFRSDPKTQPEIVFQNPAPGRHEYIARVSYGDGGVATSPPLIVYAGVSALERSASSAGDLMIEFGGGAAVVPKVTLSLGEGDWGIGMRFENIRIPPGAHIQSAYLRFTAASPALGRATRLQLRAELSADAAPIAFTATPISRRAVTRSFLTWDLNSWPAAGAQERSPNLAPVLEEVLGQPNWQSGHSILLSIRATGQTRYVRIAPPTEAPSLQIQLR